MSDTSIPQGSAQSSSQPPGRPGVARRTVLAAFGAAPLVAAGLNGLRTPVAEAADVGTAGTAATAAVRRGPTAALGYRQGTNLSVTAAPGDGPLVVEVQGLLWSVPRGGGTATALTRWQLEPTRPAFSPDGRTLAVCGYQDGGFHLWLLDADGSRPRRLTSGPWDDRGAAWSPDGSLLAFSSERGGDPAAGSSYTIWTVDVRNGALRQITAPGGYEDYDPAFTPDGARIVFVRAAHLAAGGNDGGLTLASVPLAAGTGGTVRVERTVAAGSSVLCPSVSPDGGSVAWVHYSAATAADPLPRSRLMVDGTQVSDPDEDVFPATPRWLDPSTLLYTASGEVRTRVVPGGSGAGTPGAARSIPFDARLEVERPRYRDKTYDLDSTADRPVRGIHLPALSPDGRQVAFVALNALWVMRIGSAPRRLVQSPPTAYLHMPSWAPDGRSLLYVSDREGLAAVYRHRLSDGAETTLATGGRLNPALSPDGTRLACEDSTGKILVKDLATGAETVAATPIGANGLPGRPSWSPDGRYLAICDRNRLNQKYREGYNLIRVIDTAGPAGGSGGYPSTYHLPAEHQSIADRCDSGPTWSPDGRHFALIAESALWLLPVGPDGTPNGPARRLTGDDEPADHPSWSADSGTLLYLSNGTLKLISADGSARRSVSTPLTYRRSLPDRTGTTRIHAGRMWDGLGDAARDDVDVVLRGNRIQSVSAHRGDGARAGETYLDCSDGTLLPGLWDSHTHPWQYTYGGRQTLTMLAYGITTNVSLGSFAYEAVRLRESLASGATLGPRLLATGELIDGSRVAYSMGRAHRTPEGVARTLSRAVALDYDFVKTYVRAPGSTMAAAAATAHHRLGVRSGSHLCFPGRNAGQDLTTHLQATQRLEYGHATSPTGHSYQDLLEEYRDGAFAIVITPFTALPLLGADPGLAQDPRVTVLMPPWDTAAVQTYAKTPPTTAQLDALATEVGVYRRIVAEGGVLALGTDAPLVPVGLHVHLGLRGLHRNGFSPAQALRTATVVPARLYGLGDRLGTVEAGKVADLTVVHGDPFTDFDALTDTAYAIRDGFLHRPSDLVGAYAGQAAPADRASDADWLRVARELRREGCCADQLPPL
ncbi:amidohydrolase family protein [Phaeacidiphilus oryzae]|uniref:amidohydrolase family protein n=1 Tax=Phaeacidiphilus oryzae TaxID=348818 RepID=UPI001F22C44E|nr:amidohydrolase family protein [Phaeacidiphilus oryzae]